MPRYRPFSATEGGPIADSARAAEALQHEGDLSAAIQMLERALAEGGGEADAATSGWVHSRLATLYRRVGRLEDEVDLLERYCESHQEDEWRMRFNARLYKARALLIRARERQSPMRHSVRGAMQRVKAAQRGASL
jgi:tetratricopeptide (TPR) repeat protein